MRRYPRRRTAYLARSRFSRRFIRSEKVAQDAAFRSSVSGIPVVAYRANFLAAFRVEPLISPLPFVRSIAQGQSPGASSDSWIQGKGVVQHSSFCPSRAAGRSAFATCNLAGNEHLRVYNKR